jgi:hypothetical protein
MAGSPPNPPLGKKLPEPAITRARPRLDSRSADDAAAVRAADEAARREGQLLAELSDLRAREQEAAARAKAAEERLVAAKQVVVTAPSQQVVSVAPPGEAVRFKGEFRVSDLKGWKVLLVGIVAAFASLLVAIIKAVQPEKAPVVVDNSSTIRDLQAQLTAQARLVQELAKHARAADGYNAALLKQALCVDVPTGDQPLPDLKASQLQLKRGFKCPNVRVEISPPPLDINTP